MFFNATIHIHSCRQLRVQRDCHFHIAKMWTLLNMHGVERDTWLEARSKVQCGRDLVISTQKVKEGGAPADKESTPRDGLQSICSGNPVVGLLLNQ